MTLRTLRPALLTTAALLSAGCADTPTPTAVTADARTQSAAATVPASYIVVFKNDVADPAGLAQSLGNANGFRPTFTYTAALKGFAARLPEAAREALSRNPNVDYIEPDGVVKASQLVQRSSSLWGLNRIDARPRGNDGIYFAPNEGEGVEVYIVDTGIQLNHSEFGTRAVSLYDYVDNDSDAGDCDGHGTHVAGTVGGATVGVAPKVTLYAVRVLDCFGSGSFSWVIAGIDSVTKRKLATPQIPMVGNMSLGADAIVSSVNTATTNSVNAGVVWAVAAGNSTLDACGSSPASATGVLTVGSSTSTDTQSSFSNYGSCVELFAPGSSIYSSIYSGTSTTSYGTYSGTSMASPHVAGVAALYLSANPTSSATSANTAIIGSTTTGVLTGLGAGSPNRLLYNQATPPVPYTLTVTAPTNGTITGTGINCGADCTESILSGSSVTLTANPATGYRLAAWTGACTNTTGTCTVNMTGDKTVGATFELIPPPPPLHAGGITITKAIAKNGTWTTTVNLTVHTANETRIGGATVTLRWGIGSSTATATCTSSTSSRTLGNCSFKSPTIGSTIPSVTALITIARTGYGYDATANHLSTGATVSNPISITKQ